MTEKDESIGQHPQADTVSASDTGDEPIGRSHARQVLLHWIFAICGLTALIGTAALLVN